MGIDPQHADRLIGSDGGHRANADRVIAAKEHQPLIGLLAAMRLIVDVLAHLRHFRQIVQMSVRVARCVGIVSKLLDLRYADVARILHIIAEPPQPIPQARIADRAWPHIDAAPRLSEIHGYANNAKNR